MRIVYKGMALRIQCYARMPPPATGTLPGTIISPLAELAETTHIARNLTRQTKRLPPGRFLQFKVIATDGIIVIRIAENIHYRMVRWR